MAYTLGDRMRDMAKAYEKNSHLVDQLDKELTELMFDTGKFRSIFQFEELNDQRCGPCKISILLEDGIKDDYYGTTQYEKCASAAFYIDSDSRDTATFSILSVEINHYDWLADGVLDKFIATIDAVRKIKLVLKREK